MWVQEIQEAPPPAYDFVATARAHGWIALQPFTWHTDGPRLGHVQRLSGGSVVALQVGEQSGSPATLTITVQAAHELPADQIDAVRRRVRRMLRLDEDLTEFYRMQRSMEKWTLSLGPGGGRLLRCPTLFEDIVYTLCTTNVTWAGTKRMVERLVQHLGDPLPGRPELRAFPTPAAIARAGAERLRRETGLGYRSAYVWELARDIVEGRIDLGALEDPRRPASELRRDLLALRGVGDYAAATILMLLGRYEHLAIDSELRAAVARKYGAGEPISDDRIRALYEPWGRWRYLAAWFDAPETG